MNAIKEQRLVEARRLVNRSTRLLSLVDLDAPEQVIEAERQMISEALAVFPFEEKVRDEVAAQRRELHRS